jgi:extracellular elastinolytic metalloproteinase
MAQESDKFIGQILAQKQLESTDIQWSITREHVSSTSKVHHIYYQQAVDGILLQGTESSIHVSPTGEVLFEDNRFQKEISEIKPVNSSQLISPIKAAKVAITQLNYSPKGTLLIIEDKKTVNNAVTIGSERVSTREINAKLIFASTADNEYVLAWDLSILELELQEYFNLKIDAYSGAVLSKQNRMKTCSFVAEKFDENTFGYHKNLYDIPNYSEDSSSSATICENCYEVFALPLQSPYYGERTIVKSPSHPVASPYGWHDIDGLEGPEYQYTQGNNVNAFEADDNYGFQPYGEGRLDFSGFPFNQIFTPNNQYEAASLTNLFYMTNTMHDVSYVYGFTEEAGNFQVNNYFRGGSASDPMRAQGQRNTIGCGAFYAHRDDGESPVIIVGACQNKDGSFDNVVIAHEYSHGIVNRLTGGSDCDDNEENMIEGWADWFGTVLTIEPGDVGEDGRQIANYYFNKGPNGNGVRPYRYSTDMEVNPQTYQSIIKAEVPHGVGAVWANMLWEMTWELIGEHGFDPDVFNFTGDVNQDAGNVMALALVIEALKFTPCQPGFVSGRDAILQADVAIYNGYNQCFIWNAFAKRGLGVNAFEGDPDSTNDGVENFGGYIDHALLDLDENTFCYEHGSLSGIRGGIPLGGYYSGPGVTDDGNGLSFSLDFEEAGLGTHEIIYEIEQSQCANASSDYTIIEIILDEEPPEVACPPNDIEITLEEGGFFFMPDYGLIFNSSDFCSDELTYVQEPSVNTELAFGLHPIVLTFSDDVGNETICRFNIRVLKAIGDNDDNVVLNALELIELAPNPTYGQLVLNNPLEIQIENIEIRDMLGRYVREIAIHNSEKEFTLSVKDLASGSYFVTVNVHKNRKVMRLIKR